MARLFALARGGDGPSGALTRDLTASIVVFLVAMPLCMGIAVASGVAPEKGLLTGIVGGLVVGLLAGSPLQVSGPAAGLAVIVFELVRDKGLSALGPDPADRRRDPVRRRRGAAGAAGSGPSRRRWCTACWPASAC